MPELLAKAIVIILILTSITALIVVLHGLWSVAAPWRRGWSIRSPFYRPSWSDASEGTSIPEWVAEAIAQQRDGFPGWVDISLEGFDGFKGIGKAEPFVDVIVSAKNWALFPIRMQGIQGSLTIEGNTCNMPAQLSGGSRLPSGTRTNLRIHQPITSHTSDLIASAGRQKQEIEIALNTCRLGLQSEEPGQQASKVEYVELGRINRVIPTETLPLGTSTHIT